MKKNKKRTPFDQYTHDVQWAKARLAAVILFGLLLFVIVWVLFWVSLSGDVNRAEAADVLDYSEFYGSEAPGEGVGRMEQTTAQAPAASGVTADVLDYNIEAEVIPDYILDVPLDRWLQEYIHGLCEDSGLPYTLAVAVIEAESNYTPWAVSPSNDWGLMQINGVCHAWLSTELGITDFLDPWQNVRAGVYILAGYYARYGYASGTLMAYNMGEAAAEQYFAAGIYATDYSERVIGIMARLEGWPR